jgi:hypothetical protein
MPFHPGQLVFDINDPGKKGIITGQTRIVVDRVRWEVEFETNEKVFRPAEYLATFATENDSLEQRVQQGRFGRASDLRRLLTFEKLKGTLHEFIYSMDTARIDFLEYQFKPVLKFVNSPTERLLIADEVGLPRDTSRRSCRGFQSRMAFQSTRPTCQRAACPAISRPHLRPTTMMIRHTRLPRRRRSVEIHRSHELAKFHYLPPGSSGNLHSC